LARPRLRRPGRRRAGRALRLDDVFLLYVPGRAAGGRNAVVAARAHRRARQIAPALNLPALEELHRALVPLGLLARSEGAGVAPPAGSGTDLAGIYRRYAPELSLRIIRRGPFRATPRACRPCMRRPQH